MQSISSLSLWLTDLFVFFLTYFTSSGVVSPSEGGGVVAVFCHLAGIGHDVSDRYHSWARCGPERGRSLRATGRGRGTGATFRHGGGPEMTGSIHTSGSGRGPRRDWILLYCWFLGGPAGTRFDSGQKWSASREVTPL